MEDLRLTLPSAAGPVEILRGVSARIPAGARIALVGPSGSGKSTLMMVISGLERASGGRIVVEGHDLTNLSEDDLASFRRDHVGIVFQNFHLVPTMSALENVAVPLELAGHADAFERAAAALEDVGLGHRLSHFPAQLSGGEQQRVAVARAFAVRPRLLLADEPTGNLDGVTGGHVIDLLFGLAADRRTTLVLITHDAALAARCDGQLVMKDGRIEAPA